MPAALVIERDVILRNVLRGVLVGHGFELLDAANAKEARTLCESLREPLLDLVIIDHAMGDEAPGASNREVAARIRHFSPAVKVLVISDCPYQMIHEDGIPDGAWFLQKPFSTTQFVEMVRNILQPRIQ
jgi:DNA-binding response OmpR family regulator